MLFYLVIRCPKGYIHYLEEMIRMPYHEGKQQAHTYFDLAEDMCQKGFYSEALSKFNLALAIAKNNNMKDFVTLCEARIADIKNK
jgi:hypothetical protein